MSQSAKPVAQQYQGPGAIDILERDFALDGTRGLAICLVLVGHAFNLAATRPVTAMLQVVADSMAIGLDLFFILSGYLITSILIRTRESGGYFRNFYARRVLRIFPAYYLVLICVFLIRPLIGTPSWHAQAIDSAPYYWLYVQNMAMAWRGEGVGWVGLYHTWSLAIEEQYYLLWPAIVWLIPKERLLSVCLLLCGVGMAVMIVMANTDMPFWTVYVNTFSHSQGLAAGSALAAWIHVGRRTQPPTWLRAAGLAGGLGLVCVVLGRVFEMYSKTWYHALLVVASVPCFSWMVFKTITDGNSLLRRYLSSTVLAFMGRYSYGIYLIHHIVLWDFREAYLAQWSEVLGVNLAILLSGVFCVAISILLAVLMFHGVEKPILRMKRYFKPGQGQAIHGINKSENRLSS